MIFQTLSIENALSGKLEMSYVGVGSWKKFIDYLILFSQLARFDAEVSSSGV